MSTERDALIRALIDEYAAILAQEGIWREQGYEATHLVRLGGARVALLRVAERVGLLTLHDQAADLLAAGRPEAEH
jgi:hypothetical protein